MISKLLGDLYWDELNQNIEEVLSAYKISQVPLIIVKRSSRFNKANSLTEEVNLFLSRTFVYSSQNEWAFIRDNQDGNVSEKVDLSEFQNNELSNYKEYYSQNIMDFLTTHPDSSYKDRKDILDLMTPLLKSETNIEKLYQLNFAPDDGLIPYYDYLDENIAVYLKSYYGNK